MRAGARSPRAACVPRAAKARIAADGRVTVVSTTGRITVVLGGLSALAGTVVLAVGGDDTVQVIGIALLGLSGIAFTGLAFLLVGESEDRDRVRRPRG